MKKLILILSLVFVFTSCSKQNEKQAEKETEPVKPAPSLERKSVLQDYLEETADKYPIQRTPVFGEDPLPQPSFCFVDLIEYTRYTAYVCSEHADLKKEPKLESETIDTFSYAHSFTVEQCWYSNNNEGFWCYDDYYKGWIYSKDLNIENDINISSLTTDGIIEENDYGYPFLTVNIKRYGRKAEDKEEKIILFETTSNLKTFCLNEEKNIYCFDPYGFYIYNPETKEIIPDGDRYYFIHENDWI